MEIVEPQRDVEVLDQVDVLVAGAGMAGSAAALAAARAGAKTMLLERNGFLGGIATTNMISNVVNRYITRDGRVVMRGIAKEVVDRLVERGAGSPNWAYPDGRCVHDSEQLKILLNEMLYDAGATVLTHTVAARPLMEGQTVKGAYIESKMGRQAVLAAQTVDTTGEADLAWQTGCPMRWTSGSATLTFKMANVDLDATYEHLRQHPETFPVAVDSMKGFDEFEKDWVERGYFYFPHPGGYEWDVFKRAIERGDFEPERGTLFGLNASCLIGLKGLDTVTVNSQFWRVSTLDTPEVSRAELEAQRTCNYLASFYRHHIPGFERAHIVQMGTDLGIRFSRAIEGEFTLTQDETNADHPVHFDDVIACRPSSQRPRADTIMGEYSNEQHREMLRERGEFLYAHTVDIPYKVMVPKQVENLLVASGKSVSCTPQMLLRFQSMGMSLGQAAGVAASIAARQNTTVRGVDIRSTQRALLQQDVYLGEEARLRSLGLLT